MKRPCAFKCHYPDHLLDRFIVINESHEHKVSGFKLALHSEVFRALLKQIRSQELERFNKDEEIKDSQSSQQLEQQQPRRPPVAGPKTKTRRKRSRSISELENEKLKITYADVYSLERVLSCAHWLEAVDNVDADSSLKRDEFNELKQDELEGFMRTAIHYKMPTIIAFGKLSFLKILNPINCWNLWTIGQKLSKQTPQIVEDMSHYILRNFLECSESPDINRLTVSELQHFLRQDQLNVSSEIFLLNSITKWVEHAPTSRCKDFVSLLECVKLRLLSSDEVELVNANRLVQQYQAQCNRLITDASPKSGDQSRPQDVQHSLSEQLLKYLLTPRLPDQAIFVVGGWEGNQNDPNFGPSQALQVYDCRADRWSRFTEFGVCLEAGHAYSSCVFFQGKIYIIGGYTNAAPTQMLKEFDLKTRQWRLMAPMHEKRNYIAACLLNNQLYAIGGHNGRTRLSSVEKYDPTLNHWTYSASMVQVRSDAGADTLNGKIYVCGGFDGQRFFCSAEVFDPATDQWTAVNSMLECRSGVALVAHGDYLYAIGGNNGIGRLRSVERYNPELDIWQAVNSMHQQRSNFCTTLLDDEIYVIGGWNDEISSTIASVEKWNPKNMMNPGNSWKTVRGLPLPASANCCCTVDGYEFFASFLHRDP